MEETQADTDSSDVTRAAPPGSLQLGLNIVSNQLYHADRRFKSSSVLKTLLKDIQEYYQEYELGNKVVKTGSALDEGSLTHSYILEPHLVDTEYIFYPGFDKREKAFNVWKAALPPSERRTIISAAQKAKVQSWVKAYKAHPVAPSLIDGGEPEVTLCCYYVYSTGALLFTEAEAAQVPETDRIGLKVRFDSVNLEQGHVCDVKTTRENAGVENFKMSALSEMLMYDLSAALYLMVGEAFYKKNLNFYFIVLSKADVVCDVYKLGQVSRDKGTAKILQALKKFKQAKQSNIWVEQDNSTKSGSMDIEEI